MRVKVLFGSLEGMGGERRVFEIEKESSGRNRRHQKEGFGG